MKTFVFEKTFQQRIDELRLVLEDTNAGSIKDEWRDFLETTM